MELNFYFIPIDDMMIVDFSTMMEMNLISCLPPEFIVVLKPNNYAQKLEIIFVVIYCT